MSWTLVLQIAMLAIVIGFVLTILVLAIKSKPTEKRRVNPDRLDRFGEPRDMP